jgi:hypothetical protein
MSRKMKLPKSLIRQIEKFPDLQEQVASVADLVEAMEEFVDEQDEARSSASQSWLDSDKGESHGSFVDQVRCLAEGLRGFCDAFEAVDFSIPEAE